MKPIDRPYDKTMPIIAFDTDLQKLVVIFGVDQVREAKKNANIETISGAYLDELSHERCLSLREDLTQIQNTMTGKEFVDYVDRLIERGRQNGDL